MTPKNNDTEIDILCAQFARDVETYLRQVAAYKRWGIKRLEKLANKGK